LKNSSTRCELLASRCSSTPSKESHVEKEKYHPKCALSSRHSGLSLDCGCPLIVALRLKQGLSLILVPVAKTGSVPDFGPLSLILVPDFEVVVWWRGGAGASFLCRLAFFEFVEA
jgi:hypothetical protein